MSLKRLFRHHINKVTLSHHRYGRSTGMQCTSNAYLAIIFLTIKNINIWKSFDLNCILEQRGRFFKDVDVNQAVDELQHSISIEGAHISTKMLAHEIDLSAERNDLFANY